MFQERITMSRYRIVIVSLLVLCSTFILFHFAAPYVYTSLKAERCADASPRDKENCRLGLIQSSFDSWGTSGGMRAIAALHADSSFATTGCFRYAGLVGKLSYEDMVRKGSDIKSWDFPPETVWCSTGFFHEFVAGFIEDHPDTRTIIDTCTLLKARLIGVTGDFDVTCRLAAGHGLERAAARAYSPEETAPSEMTATALKECALLGEDTRLIEACKKGVMETFSNFALAGSYGLTLDLFNPLALCDVISKSDASACYWAAAQLMGKAVGNDPIHLSAVVARVTDTSLQKQIFEMGIAMMMNGIQTENPGNTVFKECRTMSEEFLGTCVEGIVHGLFVNGAPGIEYRPALLFCSSDEVGDTQLRAACYSSVIEWMRKLYPPSKARTICEEAFPTPEQTSCSSLVLHTL